MSGSDAPTTRIAYSTPDRIVVDGADLVEALIGQVSFTEMILRHLLRRTPERAQVVLLDAVLVTLMEHGLTPSAIVTRLIYDSAPEALQSAVAAGLLGVGSTFIGTMEGCSALLEEMLAAPERASPTAAVSAVAPAGVPAPFASAHFMAAPRRTRCRAPPSPRSTAPRAARAPRGRARPAPPSG